MALEEEIRHHHPHHPDIANRPQRDMERHGSYTRDTDLIEKIFPRGLDQSKEHYARGIASRYGYRNLCDEGLGEIVEVDIDKIFPCQSILNKTKVIELILFLKDNEVPGNPMGIRIGDDVYLLDGHHRVSAQILMGRKKVMMHVTTIPEDSEVLNPTAPPMRERHMFRPPDAVNNEENPR